ncbi:hypothetical protein HYPSUDRAFT_58498 [Hypholoma sublateritium FD-334 SS-4]|uniref:Uncharacterized protein n=1 Tax=Hypholoma sublateritium (strain FD-334 SS-4) TaxID=945553 RepID=A0A0D2NHA0_HYPSF|nr:hypothetical protein HYPSUDRAFT_58498 [Hypholoma sublateritium FD-334 SS-4]
MSRVRVGPSKSLPVPPLADIVPGTIHQRKGIVNTRSAPNPNNADSIPFPAAERKAAASRSFRTEPTPAGGRFSLARFRAWLFGGRSNNPPHGDLSAAQTCFNCLKYTFECESDSQFSHAWQMCPLEPYIFRLFQYVGAQSAFVETIILFFHRYLTSGAVSEKMITDGNIHGHAVFIAAFMAAFRIHYERPGTGWKSSDLVYVAQLPLNVLSRLRGGFEQKINASGPLNKNESKTLRPIFRKLRQQTAYPTMLAYPMGRYHYDAANEITYYGMIFDANGQMRVNVALFKPLYDIRMMSRNFVAVASNMEITYT